MSVVPVADWNLSAVGDQLRNPDLPYDAFEELCARLGHLYVAVKWADAEVKLAIGDAILAGERLYGEDAYQAFERFEISEESRRECVRIARQVPKHVRKIGQGLSWSHLRAVARLEPAEQRAWLKRASDEGLSHHALRDALRNGHEPPTEVERCPTCNRPM